MVDGRRKSIQPMAAAATARTDAMSKPHWLLSSPSYAPTWPPPGFGVETQYVGVAVRMGRSVFSIPRPRGPVPSVTSPTLAGTGLAGHHDLAVVEHVQLWLASVSCREGRSRVVQEREPVDWLYRFHLGSSGCVGRGTLEIRRGERWSGKLTAALLRLPRSGTATATRVHITRSVSPTDPEATIERWQRTFGSTTVTTGIDRRQDQVTEHIGGLDLVMRISCGATYIRVDTLHSDLRIGPWHVRLPPVFAPWATAFACATPSGAFRVDVRIGIPVVGTVLAYRGVIREETGE